MKTTLLLSVLCAVMAVAASQACGTETCAPDEFCNTTTTACQCNSTFYQFKRGATPDVNLTCTGAKFNIQVSKCWLEEQGYSTSDIRLNSTNTECFAVREFVDGKSEMTLHRPLKATDCNTVPEVNATHVIHTNKLHIFAETKPIQITKDVVLNVSCAYPLNITVKLNVTLKPVLTTTVINGPSGNGSYVAAMMAYIDSGYTTLLSESDTLTVEDIIYLSVVVADLDVNTFKLKVLNIYASPTNSSTQKYYLLQDGCSGSDVPADQLTIDSNGVGNEARFPMKVFKIANANAVYLFAELALCTTDCASTCQSKARRTLEIGGRASIYLDAADTNYYGDASSASGFSMPWTLSALIFSWILMKLM